MRRGQVGRVGNGVANFLRNLLLLLNVIHYVVDLNVDFLKSSHGRGGVWGYVPPQGPSYLRPKLVGGVWQFFPRSKKLFRETSDLFFFCSPQAKFLGVRGVYTSPPPAGGRYPPQRKKRAHVCLNHLQKRWRVLHYLVDILHSICRFQRLRRMVHDTQNMTVCCRVVQSFSLKLYSRQSAIYLL